MGQDIKIFDYLLLFIILLGGFLGFVFYRGNPQAQFLVIFFTVFCYVVWGFWHHKLELRSNWLVITEYLLVGALVLLLLYLALMF